MGPGIDFDDLSNDIQGSIKYYRRDDGDPMGGFAPDARENM